MKKTKESIGRNLIDMITIHDNDWYRGTLVLTYGDRRLELTTTLAQMITCINKQDYQMETVIWRGMSQDYWTMFPADRIKLFIHESDTIHSLYNIPPPTTYKNFKDLYSKIAIGKINIIYEPRMKYTLSDKTKTILYKRMNIDTTKFESIEPVNWWFEFIDWLRSNKTIDNISIFINNIDTEVPPCDNVNQWYLNLFFKDVMRDLRRCNISLYLSAKNYNTIDMRMIPALIVKLYTDNLCLGDDPYSLIDGRRKLNSSEFYITGRGEMGLCKLDPVDLESHKIIIEVKQKPDISIAIFGSKGCGKTVYLINEAMKQNENAQ